jgi:hypothetical protein
MSKYRVIGMPGDWKVMSGRERSSINAEPAKRQGRRRGHLTKKILRQKLMTPGVGAGGRGSGE